MLDEKTINEIKKIIFKYVDGQKDKVFIFWSRATGDGRKFSDVDIGIKSTRELKGEILINIKDACEESNIPYNIDIVDFSNVSKEFSNLALKKIIKLN